MTDNEKILAAADGLLALLDEVVPLTTAHFAVEGARTALSVLRGYAEDERIMTRDRKECDCDADRFHHGAHSESCPVFIAEYGDWS